MFSKVLIANRGEIAVRIAQTCHEMGIRVVAVFSTVDRDALHVLAADEAYCVGPPPALQSYLCIEAILAAAEEAGADAIHPGYGFLAENAEFARAVERAGPVWIGPPPEVVDRMGDKIAAKELAISLNIPVVPGYTGLDQTPETLRREAENIGFPVMIKAAAGGGGKGMRAVTDPQDFAEALQAARREAHAAFGDARVFLEKLLGHPHHVEIQILADQHGNVVYLGERDCSIQRRHQKVLEESPSPVLTGDLRRAMGMDAVRLAREVGYVNAGTVEYLFSGDRYYFLEMNTRIQVEHSVTEMVTGMDLVRMQLDIAAGGRLPMNQMDIHPSGHALEVRLYAEDPAHGFLPATGKLQAFRPPPGIGIRNDVGVYEGVEVSQYYDPMLAKLIVHAGTRQEALDRMQNALERYVVTGVTTNVDFLHWLTTTEDIRAGRADIRFVEDSWDSQEGSLPEDVLLAAAAFESQSEAHVTSFTAENPWRRAGAWRHEGMWRRFAYRWRAQHYVVGIKGRGEKVHMCLADQLHVVEVDSVGPGRVVLRRGPAISAFEIAHVGEDLIVYRASQSYRLNRVTRRSSAGQSSVATIDAGVSAAMPGIVVKVAVQEGQPVQAGETLVIIEAMKMEHAITAPRAGILDAILFHEGDLVPANAPVVRLREA